jgi:hypothetical protein
MKPQCKVPPKIISSTPELSTSLQGAQKNIQKECYPIETEHGCVNNGDKKDITQKGTMIILDIFNNNNNYIRTKSIITFIQNVEVECQGRSQRFI